MPVRRRKTGTPEVFLREKTMETSGLMKDKIQYKHIYKTNDQLGEDICITCKVLIFLICKEVLESRK